MITCRIIVGPFPSALLIIEYESLRKQLLCYLSYRRDISSRIAPEVYNQGFHSVILKRLQCCFELIRCDVIKLLDCYVSYIIILHSIAHCVCIHFCACYIKFKVICLAFAIYSKMDICSFISVYLADHSIKVRAHRLFAIDLVYYVSGKKPCLLSRPVFHCA